MREVLYPDVVLIDRSGWGARADLPRLGFPVDRILRTHEIIHHSVIIDNDATPNFWERESEVQGKMRQLQTIRPDLGLDVPYNYVAFLMHKPHKYLVICEGRGLDRTGAHTHGHNTTGMALCFEGNFHSHHVDVDPWIPLINLFSGWMQEKLPNLGTIHPPGMDVFGHHDFANTACQGQYLRAVQSEFKFARETMLTDQERMEYMQKVIEALDAQRAYAIAIAKELKRRSEEAVKILT